MWSCFDGYNVSILAIPAYFMLCVLPRALAIIIAARGRLPTWDTSNTHSSDVKAQLKQRMPAETYAMYERMTACYDSGMERLALFIGAVISGNMAGLQEEDLYVFVSWFLAVRVAHIVICMAASPRAVVATGSVLWIAQFWLCLGIFVRSAQAMGAEG